ncbi:M28 family peptidase [Paractinoplanes durhamensis]|uniref:Vacuolar membrane protease n=1 Tax=Paractinoplanes durhamensis TaxID=113563 RepID=A0ABQ3Z1V2_9ACTN|nr:M28 family peptidase [Actinoplanes durhamensis]GIE03815.1 aminopeptidase [Actinoplanes durhamensis]
MSAPALAAPARRLPAALSAVAALVAIGAAAVWSVQPPAARDTSVPAAEFSAARAFAQVEAIATEPHPVGSAAQDRVREQLLTTLRGLGLTPEVQDTVSVQGAKLSSSAGGAGFAHVRNVVATIPGTASTGRIFLVAHYDSVQVGPGANDDGAGTAAILETARALTSGARLRNDVVLVLTDAEEACLCGAKAFVDQNPLAKDGGVVLNLEARGSSGPAIMFETAANNRRLVDIYGGAPKPVGTSFGVEIYRLLPNDTDFTAFREAGFTGLNSAYIDGAAVYHAPTDVPSAMDIDSLQHHGDNALAVTRVLGAQDLSALKSGDDATYFPAPGLLVRYPGELVWPLAVLALLAVIALGWLARRRGLTDGKRLVKAGALTLVPIIAAPVLAQLYWALLKLIRPGYAEMPIDPYRPGWYRLAIGAIAALVVLAWFVWLRRKTGPATLAVAGLGWLAVLGVVLAAATPGGSYLAALPALAGAIAGIVAVLTRGWWPVLAVTLGGAVAVIILLPTVIMLFPALGLKLGATGAFLAVLLGLALLPVLDLIHPRAENQQGLEALRARRRGALPTLAALLAVVVCTVVGLSVDRFDAEHPTPTHLMYALDADNGTAQWLSDEPVVQKWTSRYVAGDPHTVDATLPAFGPEEMRTGKAQAATLPAPKLTLLSDTRSGDSRVMKLLLQPQRPVRFTTLHVAAGIGVTAATIGGRELTVEKATDGPWGFGFVFHGPPAAGVEVTLTVQTAGKVKFRAMDGSDGLTTLPGFQARPSGVGIVGSHSSELLAVAATYER